MESERDSAKVEGARSNRARSTNGDEREVESGLIFNQLICEFESRHPCQLLWVVAQMVERRVVNAVGESSILFDPPNRNGTVAER